MAHVRNGQYFKIMRQNKKNMKVRLAKWNLTFWTFVFVHLQPADQILPRFITRFVSTECLWKSSMSCSDVMEDKLKLKLYSFHSEHGVSSSPGQHLHKNQKETKKKSKTYVFFSSLKSKHSCTISANEVDVTTKDSIWSHGGQRMTFYPFGLCKKTMKNAEWSSAVESRSDDTTSTAHK